MMELSSSMMALGARQLAAVLDETASRQFLGAALQLLRQSSEVARAVLPGEAGLEWLELANKLEAFDCFQRASASPSAGIYPALWAAEGQGYARARPQDGGIPLRTGAALASATWLLETSAGLESWLPLWRETGRPEHLDLAAEALGLVARNLYPYRVHSLGNQLESVSPEIAELFWHGVGRGLYFAPTHALPWSGGAGRAFGKAGTEPPHEPGRRNATAGLSWALTLVNIRHPEVVADVLWRHGRDIASAEAFANGVSSAVLVWYDAVGHDFHLANFLGYRPDASRPGLPALWRDLVTVPCGTALRQTYPRLRQSGGMAGLFRCPPPGGLGR